MNAMRFPLVIALLLTIPFSLPAQSTRASLTLADGTICKDVHIREQYPDRINISHAEGVRWILLKDLSPADQAGFHYDAKTAEAYTKARLARWPKGQPGREDVRLLAIAAFGEQFPQAAKLAPKNIEVELLDKDPFPRRWRASTGNKYLSPGAWRRGTVVLEFDLDGVLTTSWTHSP